MSERPGVATLRRWVRDRNRQRRQLVNELRLVTAVIRRRQTPVIIYQMGKVGSSTLTAALRANSRYPVFQVHRLLPANIRRVREEYRRNGLRPPGERVGLRLYRDVIQPQRPAKVITLCREPLTRNVSAFFQNFHRFVGVEYDHELADPAGLVDLFLERYPHAQPLNWFDTHLRPALGIDIYARPFPLARGYCSLKSGRFELLILKTELDDTAKATAVSRFLDLPDFAFIGRRNVAANRRYAATYDAFRRQRPLLSEYATRLHNSRYTHHFYAPGEAQAILDRWFLAE